mmetsp:Transcript_50381/g.101369  ORF Transcript_50381/g.101369 Transcript_50381/m.101369 type:complete len:226 (-) Transcript_50381:548-1225(-)
MAAPTRPARMSTPPASPAWSAEKPYGLSHWLITVRSALNTASPKLKAPSRRRKFLSRTNSRNCASSAATTCAGSSPPPPPSSSRSPPPPSLVIRRAAFASAVAFRRCSADAEGGLGGWLQKQENVHRKLNPSASACPTRSRCIPAVTSEGRMSSSSPPLLLAATTTTNGGMTWPSALPSGLNRAPTVVARSRSDTGNQLAAITAGVERKMGWASAPTICPAMHTA